MKYLFVLPLVLVLAACQTPKSEPTSPSYHNSKISNQALDNAIKDKAVKAEQPPVQEVVIPEFIVQKFKLIQAVGAGNDDKINQSLTNNTVLVDLSNFPKGYAYMGCNHINFAVALNENAFKIKNITSTRMLCPSLVSLEMSLAKQVQAVKWYAIESDMLVLYGEQVKLYFKPISK